MEPFLLTVNPNKLKEESLYNHDGEEFWMVINGRVEFIYDTKRLSLNSGDCAYFDSSVRHRLICMDKKKAKVLVVICK